MCIYIKTRSLTTCSVLSRFQNSCPLAMQVCWPAGHRRWIVFCNWEKPKHAQPLCVSFKYAVVCSSKVSQRCRILFFSKKASNEDNNSENMLYLHPRLDIVTCFPICPSPERFTWAVRVCWPTKQSRWKSLMDLGKILKILQQIYLSLSLSLSIHIYIYIYIYICVYIERQRDSYM